jgi:lipid A 3-O-deacylase
MILSNAPAPLISRAMFIAAALTFGCALPSAAEESFGVVLFQNDLFLGRDGGGYTNGLFLSKMRFASPGEGGIEPPMLLAPVVKWLGMPQSTLAVSTLAQTMVTPHDISRRVPDPHDAPYIGALTFRSTHVHVHDETADMVSLDLGVIGPAAGGEPVQRLIHSVTGSARPRGWDSQASNRALIAAEGYRAWRFPWGGTHGGQPNGDFIALGGGKLGNLETSVGGSVLLRYGEGLERSFATTVRVMAGTADPLILGRGWYVYTGLSADRIFDHVGIGGDTAQLRRLRAIGTGGVAYGWTDTSLSFSLQTANPLTRASNHRQSYGSVTFVWRLH